MKDKKAKECVAGTRRHDLFIGTELLGRRKYNNVPGFCVWPLLLWPPAMSRVSGADVGACSTADGHALR